MPFLDRRREGVLLGLVEAMDLVDEEDHAACPRRRDLPGLVRAMARTSRDPRQHGRERRELHARGPCEEVGQRRLARPRRTQRINDGRLPPRRRPSSATAAAGPECGPGPRIPRQYRGRIRSASGESAAGSSRRAFRFVEKRTHRFTSHGVGLWFQGGVSDDHFIMERFIGSDRSEMKASRSDRRKIHGCRGFRTRTPCRPEPRVQRGRGPEPVASQEVPGFKALSFGKSR